MKIELEWDPIDRLLREAIKTSIFEQLTPPCYIVGQLGINRRLDWNWNAKIDKKKVVVGIGYSSREEACVAAWNHFQELLRQKVDPKRTKKKAKP